VRHALVELGAQPFSPLHDVGRGGPEVAIADLDGLDRSASVLALLDEFDPGTLIEVGYAIRRDVPVVAYLDPRPLQHMVMIEGSGVEVVDDLSSAVYRAIWRGMVTT
jgi:nucleoside 2-deoxyribosyltransferase